MRSRCTSSAYRGGFRGYHACSVELVHEWVAGVESILSAGDPVGEDDWLKERPESDVDVAETHAPQVDDPSKEVDVSETFNLLQIRLETESLPSVFR